VAVDWGRVREIFDRAVEMNPVARPTFLAEVCGDDVELRTEVEELLLSNDRAGSFLGRPATPALGIPFAEAETAQSNGRRIGQYQVLRELGRGGMGVVYLATRADGEFHKQVAIKVLRPGVDPRLVIRFRQERQILADLEHPNIARLIDGGTADGMPYVVMEYVEGRSLRAILKERGALPLDEVVEIAKQVCAGLEVAHQQGIIHRDIKPENLIVAERSQGRLVKILDFGIARLNEPEASANRTQTGVILGTVAYMSPEQAAGATHEQIDARADVYSLGMVIYEMLTGRVAFKGDAVLAVINQHLREKPKPPGRLRPDLNIPAAIERAVLKALEKDREHRQQTIRQLAEELGTAHRSPGFEPKPQPRKWRTLAALVVTGLALSLMVFLAIKLRPAAELPSANQSQQAPASTTLADANANQVPPRYRIIRRTPNGTVSPLASSEALHEGDRIQFEFVMPFQGTFYLFYEDKDGSMVWANPGRGGAPQTGMAGSLVRVPEKSELPMGAGAGQQNYLAVYVPVAVRWSLRELALPDEIKIRLGTDFADARIPSAIAGKIKQDLNQKAMLIAFTDNQSAGSFLPLPGDGASPAKILFHRIIVSQEAQPSIRKNAAEARPE
jgi:serine/threonine protein kinase